MFQRRSVRLVRLAAGVLFLLALVSGTLRATDFIRGDANSDGVVSISDSYYVISYLFQGGWPPECKDSGDANDDGKINLTDAIEIFNYSALYEPLVAPFEEPGADPTPDTTLGCEDYGNGESIQIDRAEIRVLDGEAPGGEEGWATITIAISNSNPVAGLSGRIRIPSSFTATKTERRVLVLDPDVRQITASYARIVDGGIDFGYISSFTDPDPIPAGEDTAVLEIDVCLVEGTPAGEYPLVLEAGELVYYERQGERSGRAILCDLVGGTIAVLEEVADGHGCVVDIPEPPPEDCIPEGQVRPSELDARFEVGDGAAPPGGEVDIPFVMEANAEIQAYSVSLDFDETVLKAIDVSPSFEKPSGTEYDFWVTILNNDDLHPGSGGVDEGTVIVATVFEFEDACNFMPAHTPNEAFRINFAVRDNAQPGSTELRIVDGARADSNTPPSRNIVTAFGEPVTPDIANSFVFVNGRVNVLPDGAIFIRGDSNRDGHVNLSDAQRTLNYLFQSGENLSCFDAADANDDGAVNISDPVNTLIYLFRGGPRLPAPVGEPGLDPTPDGLGCDMPPDLGR